MSKLSHPPVTLKRPALSLVILLLLVAVTAKAQSSAPLPTDPKAILQALRDANGLSLQPATPWHLQLSWDQFDSVGDKVHSGTVDEWYAGLHRYRVVFAGDSYHQTEIATDKGLFLSVAGAWPPVRALEAIEFVTTPLHRLDHEPTGVLLQNSAQQFGSVSLSCVKATPPGYIEISSPNDCFTPGLPQLRFSRAPALDAILYNKLVVFQHRFVAQQINASVGNRKVLEIRVDKLEASGSLDEALFIPEPGIVPLSGRIAIPSSLLVVDKRGELEAERGQQGKATVHFVVGKDGHVLEATAISGPAEIQKVAVRAMRGYRFRPFLILDQPIEVEGSMEFSVN